MNRPIMTIFDCELGEQFDRQMTDEEFAQYQIDQKTQAAAQAEADAKAAAKASALAKLKALGLSDEESAAILG